jgi:hypothetical protein
MAAKPKPRKKRAAKSKVARRVQTASRKKGAAGRKGGRAAPKRKAAKRPTKRAYPKDEQWFIDIGKLLRLADIKHNGDLLQCVGVSVLRGAKNAMKTFVALGIAGCIAYGKSIFDGGAKCQRGIVLYLGYENPEGFKRRRPAWLMHHKLPHTAGTLERDALKVVNPNDYPVGGMPGLGFDLVTDVKVNKLIAYAKQLAKDSRLPLLLIVIDPVVRATHGSEEPMAFSIASANAQKISNALITNVIIMHNDNKKGQARGANTLLIPAQQIFSLRRVGNSLTAYLEIEHNREGEDGVFFQVTAHKKVMRPSPKKPPVESLACTLSPATTDKPEKETSTEKLISIIKPVLLPDDPMSEEKLLRLSGLGAGGNQRTLLRNLIPQAPHRETIADGGKHFCQYQRELNGRRWQYLCQRGTALQLEKLNNPKPGKAKGKVTVRA